MCFPVFYLYTQSQEMETLEPTMIKTKRSLLTIFFKAIPCQRSLEDFHEDALQSTSLKAPCQATCIKRSNIKQAIEEHIIHHQKYRNTIRNLGFIHCDRQIRKILPWQCNFNLIISCYLEVALVHYLCNKKRHFF